MKFPASFFLLLAAVLVCAAGDDLAALKATLQSLCNANTEGTYGSCCRVNNNGQSITSVRGIPICFGSTYVTSGSVVQYLFVSDVMRSSE